jgi:hypothetical protein
MVTAQLPLDGGVQKNGETIFLNTNATQRLNNYDL